MSGNGTALNWPADRVERRAVAALVAYARNARTHSDEQVGQIAASIREWGWTVPVLVDEAGMIIAGHGRILAAARLGIVDVPVMVACGWSAEQKRAYTIADNKLTENGGWDDALLRVEVSDLQSLGFDLPLLGFTEADLARITGSSPGLTDPDEAPPLPTDPVTRRGDVWQLGRHRLLCGDSRDSNDVQRCMEGKLAALCFTSPPYAQQRDYGDKSIVADWDDLMRRVFQNIRFNENGQLLVTLGLIHHDGEWIPYWNDWIEWMRSQGWRRFGWYIWDKLAGLPGDWAGRLAPSHEFIFHFNRRAVKPNKIKEKQPDSIEFNSHGTGLRASNGKMSGVSNRAGSLQTHKIPDSVFRVVPHKARNDGLTHPAMFSVAFAQDVVLTFSQQNDVIYEPFSGSGTVIIVAEMTARVCHAIEIEPAYCDVTIERWQNFTGEKAKRIHETRTETEADPPALAAG